MRRSLVVVFAAIATLAFTPDIQAASGGQGGSGERSSNKTISVTVSMLNLAQPLLSQKTDSYEIAHTPHGEVMVEGKIAEQFGVAGILNYGRAEIDYNTAFTDEKIDIDQVTLAAQGLWYPVGHFGKGMQLGAHVDHSRVFTGQEQLEGVDVRASVN